MPTAQYNPTTNMYDLGNGRSVKTFEEARAFANSTPAALPLVNPNQQGVGTGNFGTPTGISSGNMAVDSASQGVAANAASNAYFTASTPPTNYNAYLQGVNERNNAYATKLQTSKEDGSAVNFSNFQFDTKLAGQNMVYQNAITDIIQKRDSAISSAIATAAQLNPFGGKGNPGANNLATSIDLKYKALEQRTREQAANAELQLQLGKAVAANEIIQSIDKDIQDTYKETDTMAFNAANFVQGQYEFGVNKDLQQTNQQIEIAKFGETQKNTAFDDFRLSLNSDATPLPDSLNAQIKNGSIEKNPIYQRGIAAGLDKEGIISQMEAAAKLKQFDINYKYAQLGNKKPDTRFSDTQLNKGSLRAGINLETFQQLDPEVQNFFANTPEAKWKDIQGYFTQVQNGDISKEQVTKLIQGAELNPAVEDFLLNKINSIKTPEKSNVVGNLWNSWTDWLSNTSFIKNSIK